MLLPSSVSLVNEVLISYFFCFYLVKSRSTKKNLRWLSEYFFTQWSFESSWARTSCFRSIISFKSSFGSNFELESCLEKRECNLFFYWSLLCQVICWHKQLSFSSQLMRIFAMRTELWHSNDEMWTEGEKTIKGSFAYDFMQEAHASSVVKWRLNSVFIQ